MRSSGQAPNAVNISVQPVLTLLWSARLLGERVDAATVGAWLLMIAITALSRRTLVRRVDAGG